MIMFGYPFIPIDTHFSVFCFLFYWVGFDIYTIYNSGRSVFDFLGFIVGASFGKS